MRCAAAVSIRADGVSHVVVGTAVAQQFSDTSSILRSHSHQAGRASLSRPLGYIAHNQHRFAEGGSLFLYTPRVGNYEVNRLHEVDEPTVGLWFGEHHAGLVAQNAPKGLAHHRVEVDGEYEG